MRHRGVWRYLAGHLAQGLGLVAWGVGLVLRRFAFVLLAVASSLPALIVACRSGPR
ncbi:hypothetical protein [Streptomyces sp. NPDC059378]|uniref:hypothetical protein n=1 Tax=Streptomyces sp. NPDC059378 TaxID=3346815 RepID=UPI0036C8F9AE